MRLLSLTVMAWALSSVVNGIENNTEFGRSKTFLKNYCVNCHGNEKTKGGHNFETFNNNDWNNHELLNEILTVLKENEMPPRKAEKKPSTKDMAVYEALLAKQYLTIKSKLPGVLTRLNSAEYQNTINDAFFTKFEISNYLPVDNTRDGFDNEGDKLVMSPYAMDSYFRVASGIAEKVVGGMPEHSTTVYTYKNSKVRRLGSKGFAYYEDTNDGLTTEGFYYKDYSRGLGFAYDVRLAGYYDVKINGHFTFYDRSINFQERDFNFKVDLGKENEWLRITSNINPKVSKEPLSTHEFLLSDKARVHLEPGNNLTLYSNNYFYPLPKDLSKPERIPPLPKDKELSEAPRASLHFISAEVTGPFYESWPPKTDFYKTYYEGLKGNDPHEKYQQFIRKLAIKLFRRPVSDKELKRYTDIAKKRYETDENVFNAVQAAMTSMLCSPNFLYKYKGNSLNLDDYAIASRLSYFLWNSLPDDRLIKLASEGKLKDSSVRSAEALRMLQDPKAQRFYTNFTEQWLELDKVDTVNPHDDILTHTFGDRRGAKISQLKPFLMQEGVEFLKVILNENLSLLNFIDSDFVVINRPLNQIYEFKLPEEEKLQKVSDQKDHEKKLLSPNDFRKVMLDKESRRGGLLTQAGVLMMTTNGEFTNPFYRGAWVAKNIYGDKLSLPADLEVGALKAPTETFTIKDNINEHRNNPQCSSCHSKMDPFGLAMENFDVLGRYRENYQTFVVTKIPEEKKEGKVVKKESITRKFVETTKVESDAIHRDGRAIDGMEGLKRLMLEDKDKIARNLLTKLSEYAMGREMNYADSEIINRLLKASKENNYKLRDLIVSIIADESFTNR
tara:strand:- start:888 stop:3410 length:2523 start_codon:yes stop_codon:yes gene_type:complete